MGELCEFAADAAILAAPPLLKLKGRTLGAVPLQFVASRREPLVGALLAAANGGTSVSFVLGCHVDSPFSFRSHSHASQAATSARL
jgi:hypothetical protein